LALSREQILASSFSGPLPPPHILSEYEAVFPGCAERIVAMAERQSAHRHELERTHIRSNSLVERRGQIFAFLITGTAIAGGTYLISIGKDASGLTSIITALAALAGTFIYGKHMEAKEREQKRRPFEQREPRGKQLNLFNDESNRNV
jgi:uncharacterized membrane protein